jgi:hypothetical protein
MALEEVCYRTKILFATFGTSRLTLAKRKIQQPPLSEFKSDPMAGVLSGDDSAVRQAVTNTPELCPLCPGGNAT